MDGAASSSRPHYAQVLTELAQTTKRQTKSRFDVDIIRRPEAVREEWDAQPKKKGLITAADEEKERRYRTALKHAYAGLKGAKGASSLRPLAVQATSQTSQATAGATSSRRKHKLLCKLSAPEIAVRSCKLFSWSKGNVISMPLGRSLHFYEVDKQKYTTLDPKGHGGPEGLDSEDNFVTCSHFMAQGQQLVYSRQQGSTVEFLDIKGERVIRQMRMEHPMVTHLDHTGSTLVCGGTDGSISYHDIRQKKHQIASLDICTEGGIKCMEMSASGSLLAVGGISSVALVTPNMVDKPMRKLKDHMSRPSALGWCNAKSHLLATGTAGRESKIRFWDTSSGLLLSQYEIEYPVTGLAWSADSFQLVSSHQFNPQQLAVLQKAEDLGGREELTKDDQRVLDKYKDVAPAILWEYTPDDLGMLTHLSGGHVNTTLGVIAQPSGDMAVTYGEDDTINLYSGVFQVEAKPKPQEDKPTPSMAQQVSDSYPFRI